MMATTLLNHEDISIRIEQLANDQIDGLRRSHIRATEKACDAVVDDVLNVVRADAGLLHGGRVDVHLDIRIAAGTKVCLRTGAGSQRRT